MPKLYRVLLEAIVVAFDKEEAADIATDSETLTHLDTDSVHAVHEIKELEPDDDWYNAIPFGSKDDKPCWEVLQEQDLESKTPDVYDENEEEIQLEDEAEVESLDDIADDDGSM